MVNEGIIEGKGEGVRGKGERNEEIYLSPFPFNLFPGEAQDLRCD
ncbi:hypothetical protein COO91_10503 (plasmid) [Nostoc flagelliforme CCNUN1]|uniref:Uncharacterized protein n=1 Tax=Nostoc flagelliforme CCNUN1 TaxID=2038116 RepID=A0A2K8T9E7_9NOSO|nr:hypothetical protein COO91_10503 [Nostoc flagelliforme CCNUN1]